MLSATASQDLYPRLLGTAWDELEGTIRAAHRAGDEKRGRFRITHGTSFLARQLARLARLPTNAESAEVVLSIHNDRGRETWERRFDADAFTTVQWVSDGCLVERFGNWELRFALRVSEGALLYEQSGARFCLGPLSLPVPLPCAPRVWAREEASGSGQVHVHVTVTLPCIGPLITYDGLLDVKGFAL
jgi:hypothetical protein